MINKITFNEFIKECEFKEPNKPLEADASDMELGLHNPYSKITAIILQLYSMEFGSPPLYAELNKACRDQNFSRVA